MSNNQTKHGWRQLSASLLDLEKWWALNESPADVDHSYETHQYLVQVHHHCSITGTMTRWLPRRPSKVRKPDSSVSAIEIARWSVVRWLWNGDVTEIAGVWEAQACEEFLIQLTGSGLPNWPAESYCPLPWRWLRLLHVGISLLRTSVERVPAIWNPTHNLWWE